MLNECYLVLQLDCEKILTLLHLHVRLGELQQEVFVCEILGIVVASISSKLPL